MPGVNSPPFGHITFFFTFLTIFLNLYTTFAYVIGCLAKVSIGNVSIRSAIHTPLVLAPATLRSACRDARL